MVLYTPEGIFFKHLTINPLRASCLLRALRIPKPP